MSDIGSGIVDIIKIHSHVAVERPHDLVRRNGVQRPGGMQVKIERPRSGDLFQSANAICLSHCQHRRKRRVRRPERRVNKRSFGRVFS